jgi:hypothetical protein
VGFFDAVGAAEVFGDEESVDVDEVVSDFDGFADATHGIAAVATAPAPMPRATASAPTRPTLREYPITLALLCAYQRMVSGLGRSDPGYRNQQNPSNRNCRQQRNPNLIH